MEPYVIDVNRLVNDIKGYIAQLKSTYFENKDPIDDNEIVLQKLCVKLETALRHGMRDKFSFLGMRKDYWNFIAECLPKDEGVRYVNSLSQLNTVQGKGRALIRYCLVQKTLADTIQRTLMHRRKTEWYTPDALLINSSLSAALIAKLYDLNELEFHLSCTGCDLDMSWPSFGRSFTDGYEKRARKNSAGSIISTTDFTNERTDPLIALNAEISALKQMISRELDNDKDDGIGESSISSTDDAQPNISEITLEISRLHQFILKWKSSNDTKVYKAEHEIQRLVEENDRLSQDSNAQLTQLAEKHQNLSDLASKEATLQIIDLQNKLRNAETVSSGNKAKLDSLNEELEKVTEHYKDSQKTIKNLEKDLSDTQETTKKLEEKNETRQTECEKLIEENSSLKSEILRSQHNEASLRNKLEESESKLHIKTLEKDKIQEAFENVNGLVFGSFEDFESYYKSQLLDKEKGLEIKDTENKTLQQRLVQLTNDNERLKLELHETLGKTPRNEHVENTEQLQTQETGTSASELDMLSDTIDKANMNVAKWLHHSKDGEKSSNITCLEDKCKGLGNNLNELDVYLKNDKEALAKAVEERGKFETQCKSLSLEIERLIQQNEEIEREKASSLVNIQNQREENTKLENQICVLTAEKTKLEDTLNSLTSEKSGTDVEIQTLNEKLQEESYLRLELENEVSEITELLNKEKNEQADSHKEIERLKMEIEAIATKCEEQKVQLIKSKEELDSVSVNLSTKENELEKVEQLLGNSQKKKEEMERKQAKYEEQLANMQCTMEQQVSSLRFQLSSEALKYDEEIKTLSEEKQEAIVLREKIQENEETITELENKLEERNETWQTEKKKLTSDIKLLKNEIKVLNENIDADKQEIQSVENTLMLSKKKYEKEKNRNQEYRKTMQEIKAKKSEKEKILEQEKCELEEDIKQLKNKLISLLSDKSELWKRSNQLEFDMKTRLSETWVEDKDVTHCPQCNAEFSLFVRKHHCRFCGNVFCNNCSDNFVKTIHSRKPYRACISCFQKEKELKTDTSRSTNTSLNQDDSNLSVDSHGSDTAEEELASTPRKTVRNVNNQKDGPTVLSNEQVHTKDSSDVSDDSDENFQIIDETEVNEDFLSSSFKNSSLSIEHSARLNPGDGSQDWNEATIPAGKRYLMSVEVLVGSQYVVEFTTSEQDIFFGAAIQETANGKSKTLIPLCQINSHKRCAKKQINVTSSGILVIVFDNTHSKSTIQQLRFKMNLKKPTHEHQARRGTK